MKIPAFEQNKVEPAVSVNGLPYKLDDVALESDIGPDRQTVYLASHLRSAIGVRIGHDDTSRTLGSESPAKRPSDTARTAGHDGHFIVEIHVPIRTLENGGAKLDHRAANRSCFWAE